MATVSPSVRLERTASIEQPKAQPVSDAAPAAPRPTVPLSSPACSTADGVTDGPVQNQNKSESAPAAAEAAAAAVAEAERVLESAGRVDHGDEHHYSQKHKQLAEYDGINPESDLTQSREHFAKLKFNFIELETKQEFMERLGGFGADEPGAAEPDAEALAVKDRLKSLKRRNQELETTITTMAGTVAARASELADARTSVAAATAEVAALLAEAEQLDATLKQQNDDDPDAGQSLEELRAAAAAAELAEEAAAAAAVEVQTAVDELRSAATSAERGAELAGAARSEAETALATAQQSSLQQGRERREQLEWYAEMTATISELAGTTVRDASEGRVELDLKIGSRNHTLTVVYTGAISSPCLAPGALLDGSADRIAGIGEKAAASNDIGLLVRHVRALLTDEQLGSN